MTSDTIRKLAVYLPQDSMYFAGSIEQASPSRRAALRDRVAICLQDPAFGWHFASDFARRKERLPVAAYESGTGIARAHGFLTDVLTVDEAPARVYELLHPTQSSTRMLLNALLICRDIELNGIATATGIPEQVVSLYSEVLFNVRDRAKERTYISSLLYPQTRAVEFHSEYLDRVTPALLLLRAGYNYGSEEVLYLAGLRPQGVVQQSESNAVDDLERMIKHNAKVLSRHGGLNQRNSPGIALGKSIYDAEMQREKPVLTADEAFGLQGLSLSVNNNRDIGAAQGEVSEADRPQNLAIFRQR